MEYAAMIDRYDKLIFIDLETTGPNPVSDAITEIGIVQVTASGVTRWSSLVNPEMPIPPFIQKLTGITDAMVATAPPFAALAESLLQRLKGGLFIAHNARFDYGFLRNAFKRLDYTLHCDVLCTVKLSRKLFPTEAHHNLDALTKRYGLLAATRHRALADADLLWQFWRKLEATIPAQALREKVQLLLQRPRMPEHLPPELLDELPDTAGVYVFYGEHDVPLYVGRGIQLRSRVLSHFTEESASDKNMWLSHQVRRLDWQETAGEVGAQLLEAKLIRSMQPAHHVALHRGHELCSWQLRPAPEGYLRPVLTLASEQDFGRAEHLHGLFNSPSKAQAALHALAQSYGLCPMLLGLESSEDAGKPCCAYLLGHCRGACIGRESIEQHQARLVDALAALKVKSWPYAGAVGLVETSSDGRQEVYVVNNWCCLGTAHAQEEIRQILDKAPAQPAFELDTYKIATRALALGKVHMRPLWALQSNATQQSAKV
jgi:DNA polymerase III subunit epsilon